MRVHRITIRDVKGVRESTVEFPESGVVVVEGPNEVGKSTLLEAFDRLLDPRFKATSTSKEIKRLQPVGRDVGPFVEAEFTVGGQRVRYAKRWLRQPATTLDVLAPAPEQLTGEAAHARLERLLKESLDRTLWDALRLTQSADGTPVPLSDSAVLSAALDAAAGSRLHAEGSEQVLGLAEREYLTYFTPTGRPTSEYKRAMVAYTEVQDRVSEAHRRLDEATQLIARQEAARRHAEATAEALDAARTGCAAAQESWARADAVVQLHECAKAVLGQASERARAIVKDRRRRADQAQALDRLGDELGETERQQAADREALDELRPQLEAADDAVTLAEGQLERAEVVCDLARSDVDRLTEVSHAEVLGRLVERVGSAVEQLCAAREQVPARPVSAEQLRRARALQHRIEVLTAQHEAASARVRVESLGSEASLTGGRAASPVTSVVGPGETYEGALTHELVVTVAGALRVVLEPEAGGRARLEDLADVSDQLASLLVDAGATSVEDLTTAAEATSAAQASVRDHSRELESLLAGRPAHELREALAGSVPADLAAELAARRDRVGAAPDRVDGHPLPPDVDTARSVARAADADLQRCREERRRAVKAQRERHESTARLRTRLERADGHLGSLRQQVERATGELAAARAVMTDEAFEQELQHRSTVLAQAEGEESQARRAVAEADVQGVAARLTAARRELEAAEAAHGSATAVLNVLTGQVEMAQSEGRRELYDLQVAALDEAERRLTSLDRRARAARHLWRTLTEHRDRAHATYALPYTQALEQLGRRVYGPGFAVSVDDQLVVRSRTLDGETVPFEELSGGAKEQLGILARLAVARLVDPTQGVPVVIDDALGYSDPGRLRQMGEVLGASADGSEVQVILLTCTPDRYSAVPHAQTVRLSA